MKQRFHGLWTLLAVLLFSTGRAVEAQTAVSFDQQIRPIFESRCAVCHGSANGQAELSLTGYAGLMKGGKSGPALVAGHPEESLLIRLISGPKPAMPKTGDPLSDNEVASIRRWIAEGATNDGTGRHVGEDAGAHAGEQAGDQAGENAVWWSFRALTSVPAPETVSPWVRTDIDRFILAKLNEKGLSHSPEAERRTLIRRLTYDLHGLPPTPDEVEAFVEDDSERAYQNLVDRLLASPRYGERWGRHWLDVVHYGESHGYDKDKARRHSWPYRDWVIRSFNEDKPYARFVEEQLAGDVPAPDSPEGLIATGFIAAGPWDYVGHAELREGTKDKKIARLLDRDDMLTATMSTFVSLTAHCARCHDHKFDPIKQEDYYSLQAVFAGVDRAELPYDRDPVVHKKRQAFWKQRRQTETAMQPLLAIAKEVTSPAIKVLDARKAKLSEEFADLLPKVGEVETEQTKARQAEISEEQKAIAAERKPLVRALLDAPTRERLAWLETRLEEIDAALEKLPEPEWVYTAANYFKTHGNHTPAWEPRPIHLLARGSVEASGRLMSAGTVSAVRELPARFELPDGAAEGERRLALAKWITDPANPLTWRSIVNRVWHYHFGRGLVDSPNDFGKMGGRPTHPALLDWLAVWFRDRGGSLKSLHRLLVTSAVYRQASFHNAGNEVADGSNQFLWRMNRRRLDAESLRDAVLAVSGQLDRTMGGPSAEHFFFKDDHSPIYDYARFDFASPAARRRSVYRFLVRSVQDPFMESLDCADPSLLVDKRSSTLTAVQALALLNDPLMVQQSEHFAARLRAHSRDLGGQVDYAYRLALGRPPDPEEARVLADYATRRGTANLARLIFNSNEFLFVD